MYDDDIQPGDIIEDVHRLYSHYGIVSDRIGPDGNYMIIAHSRRQGTVVEEPWDEAFSGHRLKLIKHPGILPTYEVLARARSQIGVAKYSLLKRNCEHFVRWCHDMPVRSRQVNGSAVGSMVGFGVGLAITRNWRLASTFATAGAWVGTKLAKSKGLSD